MLKKLRKKYIQMKFLIKIAIIPRTSSRTSKLQEKPSALKIAHTAFQKMKYYCFIFFWVILALLDPDPGTPLNPDPQHCQKLLESNQLVYRRTLTEQINV
jgi:hypothetical protein